MTHDDNGGSDSSASSASNSDSDSDSDSADGAGTADSGTDSGTPLAAPPGPRKWLYLACAISTEVAATLALRAALDDPPWYVLVVAGYLGAFTFLALVLREGMPVGVAYGIWGASGVAVTAVLAAFLFGDPLTWLMGLGVVAVAGGVLTVEIGAQRAATARDAKATAAAASGAPSGGPDTAEVTP